MPVSCEVQILSPPKSADICPDYASHSAQALLDRLRAHPVTDPHGSAPPFRIHSRPLGNVAYFMTSLFTPGETVRAMEEVILQEVAKK